MAKLVRQQIQEIIDTGGNFFRADLSGLDLSEFDFRNADLREANLTGTSFRGGRLMGADLRGAILKGTDLRDTNLNAAKADLHAFDGAIYDSDTRWPNGRKGMR